MVEVFSFLLSGSPDSSFLIFACLALGASSDSLVFELSLRFDEDKSFSLSLSLLSDGLLLLLLLSESFLMCLLWSFLIWLGIVSVADKKFFNSLSFISLSFFWMSLWLDFLSLSLSLLLLLELKNKKIIKIRHENLNYSNYLECLLELSRELFVDSFLFSFNFLSLSLDCL